MSQLPQSVSAPMVELHHVCRYFGRFSAVHGLSLAVRRGEILGLIGPNGAGKTTTIRMIAGYLAPSAGSLKVCGHDVEAEPVEARRHLGYLPENAPTWPEMSVESFLRFSGEIRGLRGRPLAAALERVVAACDLGDVRHEPTGCLSKGYRHRAGLAQAILHDPEVLILDEPTDGLDPNQKREIRALIRTLGQTKAIIISTHVLEEVETVCNQVAVIAAGQLAFSGSAEEFRRRSPGGQLDEGFRKLTGAVGAEVPR